MLRAVVLACIVVFSLGCGSVSSKEDGATPGADAADASGGTIDAPPIVYDAPPDATPCPAPPCQDGLACTSSAGCVSGNCECTDAECTVRVCAPADCLCGFGADGTCGSQLTGGQADPEDCEGANGCFAGECKRASGEVCATGADCGTGQCECTDANCTVSVCAAADCVCRYGSGGACTATLTNGAADPEDCTAPNACFAGACKKVNGQACIANTECGSEQCECTSSNCSTRVCAAASCTCRYGTDGACTNDMLNAVDDPEDCAAAGQSCYAAACRSENLANGSECVDDRQCTTGACECKDATCTSRWCAAVSCTCTYNGSATSASCPATPITNNFADPNDCFARVGCGLSGFGIDHCACNGLGACVIKATVVDPG